MPLLRKLQTASWLTQSWFRGWRCHDKIVVIESDDWGAIRTSSRANYDHLVAAGYSMNGSALSVDSIETESDLACLFDTLEQFKDRQGRSPCITANMNMANPDFEKIREAKYNKYYYEPITRTLGKYPDRAKVKDLWKEGLERRIFVPQFHSREHVCWWKWIEALRQNSKETLMLFEMEMCGLPMEISKESRCFDGHIYAADKELKNYGVDIAKVIREGAALFKKEFGETALSTIAPNYCWTENIEKIWETVGIKYIQGSFIQICGTASSRRKHHTGERNPYGGIYLVRNCNFEQNYKSASRVACCLRQISWAFQNHQPAILCSHRANYAGSICEKNRERGIRMLGELLRKILKRWPDVVFLSTPELGRMIEHNIGRVE